MPTIEHLTIQGEDTAANLIALGAYVPKHWYFATDSKRLYYAADATTLVGPIQPGGSSFISAVSDTNSIDLTEASGTLTADIILDPAGDNILEVSGAGAYVKDLTIAAGSSAYLSFNSTTRELSVDQLLVSDVTVDTTNATMASFISGTYDTNVQEEGDILILTLASPTETWIQNGGSAGTIADWTQVSVDNLSDSYVRALFSITGNGIDYNNSTGVFNLNFTEIGAAFSWGDAIDISGTNVNVVLNSSSWNAATILGSRLQVDVRSAFIEDTENLLGGGAGFAQTVQNMIDYLADNIGGGVSYTFGDGIDESGGTVFLGGNIQSNRVLNLSGATNTLDFQAGTISKMILDADGTNSHVRFGDDIRFTDDEVGPIMRSPDLTYWRLQVSNNGVFTATSL